MLSQKKCWDILHNQNNQMPPKGATVHVGMSGGVDSSVAAILLKKAGYDVRGIFIICWDKNDPQCSAVQDKHDAQKIAGAHDIPFETVDFTREYKEKVMSYTFEEHRHGNTPNPDILCNTAIKFGVLIDHVRLKTTNPYIATGHYAQVTPNNPKQLLGSSDESKDQSYFLYKIGSELLGQISFPIGSLPKSKVRALAASFGLDVANKPDSQGLCFVGNINMRNFISKHVTVSSGKIIDLGGRVIGSHGGYQLYTIGQRHGFHLNTYFDSAMYVIDKNISKNEIVVSLKENAMAKEFLLKDIYNLYDDMRTTNTKSAAVRIRNLGQKTPIDAVSEVFEIIDDYSDDTRQNLLAVRLTQPEFGVAPGQHAVFYQDDIVLGGGVIKTVNTSYKKRFKILENGT